MKRQFSVNIWQVNQIAAQFEVIVIALPFRQSSSHKYISMRSGELEFCLLDYLKIS